MKTTKLHYSIALSILDGIGPRTVRTLISHFGDPEEFFNDKKLAKNDIPGFSKERLKKLDRTKALLKAEKEVEFVLKNDIKVYYFQNKDYPERLKNCVDAPIIMYGKGNWESNPSKVISVVGTRNITDYGKDLLSRFFSDLKGLDIQVVSGLAYGVDVLAHRYCLKYNIPTIGVLGHGLDRIYPTTHRNVATKMIKQGGGILTEFRTETNPDRENFPQRNRIVAGITDATIVIESGQKGGSLITAHLANDYNRDVFAFPGNITSDYSIGCNKLIANDIAHLITSGKDLIDKMGWDVQEKTEIQRQLFTDLSLEEKAVVELMRDHPISVDNLSLKLEKPVSKLNSLLMGLEIRGIVQAKPGNKFIVA